MSYSNVFFVDTIKTAILPLQNCFEDGGGRVCNTTSTATGKKVSNDRYYLPTPYVEDLTLVFWKLPDYMFLIIY